MCVMSVCVSVSVKVSVSVSARRSDADNYNYNSQLLLLVAIGECLVPLYCSACSYLRCSLSLYFVWFVLCVCVWSDCVV